MGSKILLSVAVVVWAGCIAGGFVRYFRYESTPGKAGLQHVDWPAGTRSKAPDGKARLLMFVHPQCPCSRASLEELADIAATSPGQVDLEVQVFAPVGKGPNWTHTDLWQQAAQIPGVRVEADPDGAEARRFGAATSGTVLLYNGQGQLLFSGGITGSRGHTGDNAGQAAVVALLNGKPASRRRVPVFGCSLYTLSAAPPAPTQKG